MASMLPVFAPFALVRITHSRDQVDKIQEALAKNGKPRFSLKDSDLDRAGRIVSRHVACDQEYIAIATEDDAIATCVPECVLPKEWTPKRGNLVRVLPMPYAKDAYIYDGGQWTHWTLHKEALCRKLVTVTSNHPDINISNGTNSARVSASMLVPVSPDSQKNVECRHEWVNAGFYTVRMVCKHCDTEKETQT